MRTLVDQLEKSLGADLYVMSLMAALAIPDIAGALDSADGLANGERYAAWFEKWVRPEFATTLAALLPPDMAALATGSAVSPMTGEICYRFRCSLLHQGTTQHPKNPFRRLIFVEPGTSRSVMHYNQINDALNIDLRLFCREVISGTRKWLETVEQHEPFKANYNKFVRCYPAGLPPYISGLPVVG